MKHSDPNAQACIFSSQNMRRLFVFAALFVCVFAGTAEDAQFLADVCATVSVPGTEPSFCAAPLTVANYCASDEIVCNASNMLVQKLNITGMTGAVPSSIGSVVGLESFCLTNSELTSPIDAGFAALPLLGTIEMRSSMLVAPLPDGAYPALKVFFYDSPEPIPVGIYPARPLREFTVINNSIDVSFLPVATLEELQITASVLSGTLPAFPTDGPLREFLMGSNAGTADFGDNDSMFRIETLERFFILSTTGLIGTFPTSFTSPSRLNCLKVVNSGLSGTLDTTTLRYATELEDFILLANSDVSAVFDDSLCHLRKLRRFTTDDFSGEVPTCVGDLPLLTALTIQSPVDGSCDPALGVTGTLEPSFLRVLRTREDSEFAPTLVLAGVCFMGTIPELPFPLSELSPSLFEVSSGSQLIITRTQLRSPYPAWIRAILDNSGPYLFQQASSCILGNNRFCHKPPVPESDLQCSLTVDATTNVCGQCDEPDTTCEDCKGVVNGPAVVDECGVCGGSNACVDCAGAINGTSVYDECDVCDGNGMSCVDCTGTLFGNATYDLCDVCGGDSLSCLDCSGVAFGTLRYDICDVCGGAGGTCADCDGVVGGPKVRDVCGECVMPGAVPQCYDCAGVPHGTALRDACLVCGGDGSSCDTTNDHHVLAAQLALERYGWIVALPITLLVIAIILALFICCREGLLSCGEPNRPRHTRTRRRVCVASKKNKKK